MQDTTCLVGLVGAEGLLRLVNDHGDVANFPGAAG
jgi:hypothetical protein